MVATSSTDMVAIGGGAVALLAGIYALATAGSAKQQAMIIGGVIAALGVFQLLRGTGIV